MNDKQLSKCLAQLGNETRLKIFKLLIQAGEEGLPVGSIQERLIIPGSTLSHHITKLISADLIVQKRDGRTLYCIANYDILNEVFASLKEHCCLGFN